MNKSWQPSRLQSMQRHLYSVAGSCPEYIDYVRQHELDIQAIHAHAGILAVALCHFAGADKSPERFEFTEDGTPSAVIEVLGVDGASVVDLVAWPIGFPDCFATAIGNSDMLGIWGMVQRGGTPLMVHRSPHDWLCSGCQGCTILNPQWGRHWLFRAGGPFIAHDIEHGRTLRAMLAGDYAATTILVPLSTERKAA